MDFLSQLSQRSWQEKIGLLLVLGLLIILLGYFLFVKEHGKQLIFLTQEEQHLRKSFTDKQQRVVNLKAYLHQYGVLFRKLPALGNEDFLHWEKINIERKLLVEHMSTKQEMPLLLKTLAIRGKSLGLKFIFLAPQEQIQQKYFVEVPIKMTIEGTYFQLACFVSEIAHMPKLITFQDLDLSIKNKFKKESLLMHLVVKVYQGE